MSSTSPNMLLVIPDPQVTPGPAWAQQVADALERIDEHDHTTGMGVALSSQSIIVDADLSLEGFNLINIRTLRLSTQLITPITSDDLQIVYSMGGELFYRDDAGNAVQITNGGSIAGTAGTIANLGTGGSSANFNDTSDLFTFLYSPSKPGKFAHADLDLYPYDGSNTYTNNVTLRVNTTLSGDYSFILPDALPARQAPLTLGSTGQVTSLVLNDGQVLIGSSSGSPLAATITGTANQITVTNSANTITLSLPTNIRISDGTAAAPTLAFSSDINTGIYSEGADQLGFSTNGITRAVITTTSLRLEGGTILLAGNGTSGAPGLSFLADPNTGIYRDSADSMTMVAGGIPLITIQPEGAFVGLADGSNGSPSLYFESSFGTGLYWGGGTIVGVSGSLKTSGTIETNGGGAFKVYLATGSLGATSSTTITAPGDIVGISGFTSINGTTVYKVMDQFNSGVVPSGVYFDNNGLDGTSTSIKISNGEGGSRNYRITIVYV